MQVTDLRNPLTRAQLIARINRAADVPLFNERLEQLVISWLYDLVVHFLPPDAGDVIISESFRRKVIERVNNTVNIPVIPEVAEAALLGRVYDTVAGFLVDYVELPADVRDAEREFTDAATEELTQYNIKASNRIKASNIPGSGKDGRVTVKDVREAIQKSEEVTGIS